VWRAVDGCSLSCGNDIELCFGLGKHFWESPFQGPSTRLPSLRSLFPNNLEKFHRWLSCGLFNLGVESGIILPPFIEAFVTNTRRRAGQFVGDVIHAHCVGVTDGDTIKVLTTEKQLLRIRVAWIDAPEMGQAFGQRAKQSMSALVFGKDVELRPHAIDRYGRMVAMVFVDGRDVGLELIRAGLAWKYDHYLPEASPQIQTQYTAAETAARAARLGLWQEGEPVPPWEWRRAECERRTTLDIREKVSQHAIER
jgi:endonuclease YncB( thermonuclease family)